MRWKSGGGLKNMIKNFSIFFATYGQRSKIGTFYDFTKYKITFIIILGKKIQKS